MELPEGAEGLTKVQFPTSKGKPNEDAEKAKAEAEPETGRSLSRGAKARAEPGAGTGVGVGARDGRQPEGGRTHSLPYTTAPGLPPCPTTT